MRVWVTRARPGADETAQRLTALGHDPLVVPVLAVRELEPQIELSGVAALAFTSRNGVAAFARLNPERALPVFTVGDATAQAAREAGFGDVRSAHGDVNALAALLAEEVPALNGAVLHAGAREPAGDLPGLLAGRVNLRTVALYETAAADPADALARLDTLDAVLVHSPKAGRRLAAVLDPDAAGHLSFACISPAAAEPLAEGGFKKLHAARFPDEGHLLKLLAEPLIETP
nr:uroporphyrinogen-III synthase [Caulobacter sp. 17J80-11]